MIFDDMKTDLGKVMEKFIRGGCDITYKHDGENVIFYILENNGIHIQININCISDAPICYPVSFSGEERVELIPV
ncbi:hypothetical protein [Morganella psychrotolerans]|uniref:hypothetical protein n=1 Tax=Morganella psychrotolerans TaxID=368603 RepID=UPI0039AF5C32